jgi:serine/threonine protein kinase SCH9
MLELELVSFKYFHNMFRHWTPDQLTPRANEKNPFNDVPTTPTAVHPLLSSGLSVTSDLTPAQPTTHLSIHAPIFIMQQPPPAKNLIIKSHPPPLPQSSSTPPSSKGQIHVKLIQARALNVRTAIARPYVVVQFEQNEFVSRDPTLESDKEVKGSATSLSTSISPNALSALGAIGSKASIQGSRKNSKNSNDPSPPSTKSVKLSSHLLSPAHQSPLSNDFFGRLSVHNPVWKHEVSLYAVYRSYYLPDLYSS